MRWKDLIYWQSGEYQVVQERLSDLSKAKIPYCPGKANLFKALDLTPFDKVQVVLLGQDPYPDPELATGLAFSVPPSVNVPPTLSTIFREYTADLGLPPPTSGDLTPWASAGVLLWNVYPSCEAGKSMSHAWDEWTFLTAEILANVTRENACVVAALGTVPREFLKYVAPETPTFETSHPSPRGQMNTKSPFIGSKLFSSINNRLRELGVEPVDWRLSDEVGSSRLQR